MNLISQISSILFSLVTTIVFSQGLPQQEFAGTTYIHFPAGQCECEVLSPLGSENFSKKTVAISPFWLATTEVTVGEFKKFCDATSYVTEAETGRWPGNGYVPGVIGADQRQSFTWKRPGFEQTDVHPVTCVSGSDITAYCQWISNQHPHRFRLPNTAEWQFACLHASKGQFDFDDNDDVADHVNFADRTLGDFEKNSDIALGNTAKKSYRQTNVNDGFVFTAPVRAKKPGRNGLYSMHGNVCEFCELSTELLGLHNSPASLYINTRYVIRSGGWFSSIDETTGQFSSMDMFDFGTNYRGFRIVCDFKKE